MLPPSWERGPGVLKKVFEKGLTFFLFSGIIISELRKELMNEMKTLNEEITRIKSEIAEIASKTSTGKTIQEQIEHLFSEIALQEYDANKKKVLTTELNRDIINTSKERN